MNRKDFARQVSLLSVAACLPHWLMAAPEAQMDPGSAGFIDENRGGDRLFTGWRGSPLGKLMPIGRALELEGYYVWCSCPIEGPDGKIHLFFSRWDAGKKMSGWINGSEIAHAVADSPESPFECIGTVLSPRGAGHWDATTCHNPLVKRVGDRYYLFYMGNSNGRTNTKRIGMAIADSLYGPWKRPDKPLLEAGPEGAWDDHCTTNPAFIHQDDGRYWLYYKSWNTKEYETSGSAIRGNRKYGVAMADKPEGPYRKYDGNPVIDFSGKGDNKQLEDAFIWKQKKRIKMIARDMGIFNHEAGLYMESKSGIRWSEPEIAYNALTSYVDLPPAPPHLKKYGRLERPMLLIRDNKPTYLFGAAQGGKFMTSSTFIFKIG